MYSPAIRVHNQKNKNFFPYKTEVSSTYVSNSAW